MAQYTDLISLAEASRLLGVSKATGRRAYYRSQIQGRQTGGMILIERSQLERLKQYVHFEHKNFKGLAGV